MQSALKLLQTIEKKITTHLQLRLDYSFISITQSILHQYDATEIESHFSEQVEMVIEIEKRKVTDFMQTIINKSGAKVFVSDLKEK